MAGILQAVNTAQAGITTRQISAPSVVASMIGEADNMVRDGGTMFDVQAPPLRVRELQRKETVDVADDCSVPMPADLLGLIFLAPAEKAWTRLKWVPYETYAQSRDTFPTGTNEYTFFQNQVFVTNRHKKLIVGYHGADERLTDDGGGWLWNNTPEVFTWFLAARVFQNARHEDQAKIWFMQFSDKLVRLNRTYGENALLKGARMSYRGHGQIGRRSPKYY